MKNLPDHYNGEKIKPCKPCNVSEKWWEKFPDIYLKANASRSKNINGSIIKSYDTTVAASYEIDLWDKIKSSRQSAWFKRMDESGHKTKKK